MKRTPFSPVVSTTNNVYSKQMISPRSSHFSPSGSIIKLSKENTRVSRERNPPKLGTVTSPFSMKKQTPRLEN